MNGRYTEDASAEKKMKGRSTMWNGNYYLFWCSTFSYFMISHESTWDANAAVTRCDGSGQTSGDNKHDLLQTEFWNQAVDGAWQQNDGVAVAVPGEWWPRRKYE
jgi:hypothetical protein